MKNKVPKLRFKEFTNEWKIIRMKEIFPKIRNGFVGIATPFYIESGIKYLQGKNIKNGKIDPSGLVNITEEFHIKKINSQLYTNDILMVQSGHIGECAKVTKNYENSNCHALLILTPTQKVNSDFFVNYFYSPKGKKHIYKIKTGNTIEHILSSDVKELEVKKPSLLEQEKIANFLSSVDIKIEKLEKKKDLLEKYKKGMMQKLFSQKLRFKDDNGNDYPEWEEKRLGEIAKFSKGKNIAKTDISEEGFECIRYGELYTKYNEVIKEIISKTDLKETELVFSEMGDIIIPASGETAIDLATASCVLKTGVALGGDINIIKTKENGIFLSYYMNNSKKYEIASLAQGISVIHIYNSQLELLKLSLPSLPEQEKIANFLSSIDRKIELVEQELDKNKEFKKGLLQQMFV